MNRTNVPQEFEVIQRESQQALVILGDLIAELEKAPKRGRHRAQPEFARSSRKPYVITYSTHS